VRYLKTILYISLLLVSGQAFGQSRTAQIDKAFPTGAWHPTISIDLDAEGESSELSYICNSKNRNKLVNQSQEIGFENPEQMWDVITVVICGKGKINLRKLTNIIRLPFDYSGNERVKGFRFNESDDVLNATEARIKNWAVLYKISIPYPTYSIVSIGLGQILKNRISVSTYGEAGDEYNFQLISGKWYWVGYKYLPAD
jgi:hypothetical protein